MLFAPAFFVIPQSQMGFCAIINQAAAFPSALEGVALHSCPVGNMFRV